jgi:hypothetical protein
MIVTRSTAYPDYLADEVEDIFDTVDTSFDVPQDETIEHMEVLTEQ